MTGIVLGSKYSLVNRTSKIATAWSLYSTGDGRKFGGAYIIFKKVVLSSRKKMKSGQGKEMECDKCFCYQTWHVKYLKNDVSVSVLCRYGQTNPFIAVVNQQTLLRVNRT